MSPDVLEELQQCINKMQQLFQECIKSDKDRKGLPREAPGDLLYHRSSSLVGVVVRLGTSRGTAHQENCKKRAKRSTPQCRVGETTQAKLGPNWEFENPFVAERVEEHTCHITIDTGSYISIIRPDVLSEKEQTHIQPVSQSICTVGTQEAVHPIWVAEIQDECIFLGLDFLELHGCIW